MIVFFTSRTMYPSPFRRISASFPRFRIASTTCITSFQFMSYTPSRDAAAIPRTMQNKSQTPKEMSAGLKTRYHAQSTILQALSVINKYVRNRRIVLITRATGLKWSMDLPPQFQFRSKLTEKGKPHHCGSPFVVWFFGRRGVLLHLSGFPCQYHRRVDATKLSTSKNHSILLKI